MEDHIYNIFIKWCDSRSEGCPKDHDCMACALLWATERASESGSEKPSNNKSSPKCSRCGIDHEDGLCGKCAIEMTKEIKQMEAEIRGYNENTSGN